MITAPALQVTQTQQAHLQKMAASTTLPHRMVMQVDPAPLHCQDQARTVVLAWCHEFYNTHRRHNSEETRSVTALPTAADDLVFPQAARTQGS